MKGHLPVSGVQADYVLILLANGELQRDSTSSDSSHRSSENGEYSSVCCYYSLPSVGVQLHSTAVNSTSCFTVLQLILRLNSLYCR
jgi:hypothetical protein